MTAEIFNFGIEPIDELRHPQIGAVLDRRIQLSRPNADPNNQVAAGNGTLGNGRGGSGAHGWLNSSRH